MCLYLYFVFRFYAAPEWATECLIRALPSLTIQYIADSATIELSRDCGTEGIKRLTCNGKQDQDVIQRELMCMSERESITSDNEMKATADEMPIEMANEMTQSDNTENNNIDKMANQIEATVDKVADKYNLDEVMMGDAPIESQEDKPVKSVKKIASEKPLKNQPKQMRKLKGEQKDDQMMGDQPAANIPIDEILPHVKKVINDEITFKSKEIVTTPKNVVEYLQTTVEVRSRRETEIPVKANHSQSTTESNIKIESEQQLLKDSHKGITFDHFIPPMLLVQHQNSTAAPSTDEGVDKSTTLVLNSTKEPMQEVNQTSSTQVPTTISNDSTIISSNVEITSTTLPEIASISSSTQGTTSTTTASAPTHAYHPQEYPKTNMMRPHAPKFGGEISFHAPNLPTKDPIDSVAVNESNPIMENGNTTESMIVGENATNTSADAGSTTTTTITTTTTSNPNEQHATEMTETMNVSTTVTSVPHLEVAKRSNSVSNVDKYQHKQEHSHEQKPISHQQVDETNTKHADFTNSNLDYQYKPNRKRILTKAEAHTYIQKIFG